MNAIKFVINVFAGILFSVPVLWAGINVFSVEQTSYITMLVVCTLGFLYCMNTTVFSEEDKKVSEVESLKVPEKS